VNIVEVHYIYMYENSTVKPPKNFSKGGGRVVKKE
jgi:hypothetical protein